MKMSVLVEEGLRRLRHNVQGLEWESSMKVMKKLSHKLRRSGYPESVRHQVIKTACEKYDRMCEEEDKGGRPVHRPREWREKERRREKELKLSNWHKTKKKQVSAPLILDPTAGNLTKEMKEVCVKFEKVTGMHVAVQERAGVSNKSLAKSEPLRSKKCGRQECFVCLTRGGKCEKNGVGYELKCEKCWKTKRKTVYEGETGRNGFTRGAEHLASLRLESEDHPLWKHCLLEHDGSKVNFSMKVCGSFQSCIVRQVNEPVRMLRAKADCLMNSKSEFHQAPLVRVVAFTGLQEEQGEGDGDTLGGRRAGEQQERRGRTGRGRPGAAGRSRGRGAGRGGIRTQGQ